MTHAVNYGRIMYMAQTRTQTATSLILIGALMAMGYVVFKSPSWFWVDAWFVIEVVVITLVTRTLSIRFGLGVFAQGIVISGLITILIYHLVGLFGIHGEVSGEVIMATVEEVMKFVPVLLTVWLLKNRSKLPVSISDWLMLSVMAGAGFSMLEKSFWESVSYPFTYGPHIGGLYFFPDALGIYVSGEPFGYIGHAAATGLIGLAMGIGVYMKSHGNSIMRTFWWVLPLVAFAWVTLEHILSNAYYISGTDALLLFGGGQLTPWVFVLAMIGMCVIEGRMLRAVIRERSDVREGIVRHWTAITNSAMNGSLPKRDDIRMLLKHFRAANIIAWRTM